MLWSKTAKPRGWFPKPPLRRQDENMLYSYIFVAINILIISKLIVLVYAADN
jgi:hypothetical protein